MTRYDLLKMNASVLQIFINNKIDLKDVANIAIFEEYLDLRNRGEKFEYVVHHLAHKYNVHPVSVGRIVRRLRSDIKVS